MLHTIEHDLRNGMSFLGAIGFFSICLTILFILMKIWELRKHGRMCIMQLRKVQAPVIYFAKILTEMDVLMVTIKKRIPIRNATALRHIFPLMDLWPGKVSISQFFFRDPAAARPTG